MASAPGEAPPVDTPDPPSPDPPVPDPPAPDPPVPDPPVPDPPVPDPPVPDPPIPDPPPPDPPILDPPPPDPPISVPPAPLPSPEVVLPPVFPPPLPPSPVAPPPESPLPPPPDVVPPPESPPSPPPIVSSPPPPDVVPPPESPPSRPPIVSIPPPPDVVPPPESPPSPPPVVPSPPPTAEAPPPSPSLPSPPLPKSPLFSPPPSLITPPPPALPVPSPQSNPSPNKISPTPSKVSIPTPLIVGAAAGSFVLLLAVLGLFWFLCVRKKKKDQHEIESNYNAGDGFNGGSVQSGQKSYPLSGEQNSMSSLSPSPLPTAPSMSTNGSAGMWPGSSGAESSLSVKGMVLGSGTIAFTYDELKIATNGFSSVNLLGQGGFGYVHKGMLQNGKLVAVKSLKADSGQGEREFQAEVETISRVHHKHLVTLVGYCITDSQKLLVYEFVQNKTMEFHLHGEGQPVLDWSTRLKIAVGAAKGLAYLHEDCHPKIIHRDIKAANILLDHTFEAQVADFGLAKFSSDAHTHISTRVMGTFGYLAPEYASSGQLSDKSDVFSFGVLLLELVNGRRPVDFTSHAQMEDSLVDWARPLFAKALQDGDFTPLVDPRLENNYNSDEMYAMITCAASCVRHSAKRRPKMSEVVRALEGNIALSDLSDGVKPGFSSFYSSAGISDSSNPGDTLRFRKVFGSETDASSEYSTTHSEQNGGG